MNYSAFRYVLNSIGVDFVVYAISRQSQRSGSGISWSSVIG